MSAFAKIGLLATLFLFACGSKAQDTGTTPQTDGEVSGDEVSDEASNVNADESAAGETCQVDEDCVPATCCHPKACVVKSQAPSCDDMMCTADCAEGTMDCGKGSCACSDGACIVKWTE